MHPNVQRITQLVTRVETDPCFIGAVCPPIYDTTVFKVKDFDTMEQLSTGERTQYTYSRTSGNPTNQVLHSILAEMEQGEAAMALSSGTAAIFTAMCTCLKAGDHVIIDRNAYGRPIGMLQDEFAKFGVSHTFVDMRNLDALEAAIRPNTTLVYVETPNSWLFHMCDLQAIADLCKSRGIRTIADNTYSTPVYQNPLKFGIDVVVHSATKYLGGHSAVIAGIIVSSKEFIDHLAKIEAKLSAMDASRLLLNLRTLPLRMERHYENAKAVCALLESNNKVSQVFYPGSPNHPQRQLFQKQMYGASGTLSFVLDCDRAGTKRFIDSLKYINLGGTWGTYESTIQTTDTTPNFIPNTEFTTLLPHHCRLSVGLESIDCLLEDLDQALRQI